MRSTANRQILRFAQDKVVVKVAIVAGEASGDLHGAEVLRELKKLDPSIDAFGIGGDLLAAQGMRLLHHAGEMGIVGFFNVLLHYRLFKRIFEDMAAAVARERPDAVLLVDYPGFNLRMARRCKELGLRVVYYISPQVWAWRRGRVRHIAKYVDRMIVIFPFEETFYRQHGVDAIYVGHPIIEEIGHLERAARGDDVTRIALLPGSRRAEVMSLLPAMTGAVEILARERRVEAYVVQAPTIPRELLGTSLAVVPYEDGAAIARADMALSSSGTATLECAVLGTPVVVMYRLSRANYWLGRMVVKIPHFGLINIVAEKEVVPELVQSDVNPERIAAEARKLLEPATYARVVGELAAVRSKLGDAGAARRAAEAIMSVIHR
jgi:lipid-A-disaccharide synthase